MSTTEGRIPCNGNAALDCAVPYRSLAEAAAYLRIRLRSTYCMMPPLR